MSEVSWLDLVALGTLGICFVFYGPLTSFLLGENISSRMLNWRKVWTHQMLWREERITDVSLVRGLIGNVHTHICETKKRLKTKKGLAIYR